MSRPVLLALFASMLSACASTAPLTPMTSLAMQRCDADYQLKSAALLRIDEAEAFERRMDQSSRCVERRGGRIAYLPLRLPEYRKPYSITVESEMAGQSLFAPEISLLDAAQRVRRTLPFEHFSVRGKLLRATVFIHAQNADERYLVVNSAPGIVGRVEDRTVSDVTTIPIPLPLWPTLYVEGREYQGQHVLTHNGLLRLHARSGVLAERRAAQARPPDRADRYASKAMARPQ